MAAKKSASKGASTAVAVKEDHSAVAALYEQDAGTGFENTTSEDYVLPFLKLLQKMSPEVDKDNGAFVKGAEPGMYFDTGTQELLPEFDFIPCHYQRAIVEWNPREEGGGFVGQHPVGYQDQFPRDDHGRWTTPDGTYLADTRYWFGLRLTADGDVHMGVISMTSTQLKASRTWLTKMNAIKVTGSKGKFTPPMFAHVWHFSSISQENDKGSWRGYKIELVGPITDAGLVAAAKDARAVFTKAAVNVKPPADGNGVGDGGDEVPF